MKKIIKIYLISSLVVLIPLSVQAFFLDDLFDDLESYFEEDSFNSIATSSNVQIINEVNVSADTGGNVVESGEVNQDKSEVNVQIETTINGQSIDPVDLEVKSEQGEDAQVKVEQKITYPDEQGQVSIEREIEINEQIEDTEESQTPKEEINPQTQNETFSELTDNFSQWWSSFFGGLKEKLVNMFGLLEKALK